ncbi:AlpA family transcriptional regulator [Pseudomonas sp. B21-009]|uniref:helix-turn-helix transcriptional regulator n=1 Tax=Pseudomonas sp. B21-009 TaxID=2895470 RepID=UPI00215F033A|nr:AlpA family transcriptional regulator [Pseudomonas sp. B21-009]UVM64581.1 AlpA family transcriptional regulator [Pseudomonas sp. B21-009]
MCANRTKQEDSKKPLPKTTYRHNSTAPGTESVLVFRPELRRMLGICDSTLYAWDAEGIIPASFSLGPERSDGLARRTAWLRSEIMEWVHEQATKGRERTGKSKPKASTGQDVQQPA